MFITVAIHATFGVVFQRNWLNQATGALRGPEWKSVKLTFMATRVTEAAKSEFDAIDEKRRVTMATIYRKAEANAHDRNPQPQYPTRRPPGNVPYLVDNLWEWTRPAEMPNRRHAVFASPTPELAEQAGGAMNGMVYRVEFAPAEGHVCQTSNLTRASIRM